MMTTEPPSFEEALAELEKIVLNLERGELNLTDSLTQFERGIELTRKCQEVLAEAEQKVHILTQQRGELVFLPFETDPS